MKNPFNKNNKVFLLLFIPLINLVSAYSLIAQTTFGKLIDTDVTNLNQINRPINVTTLPDNSSILSGNWDNGFHLSKIDSSGNVMWSKLYSLSNLGENHINNVIILSDSSLICIGKINNSGSIGPFRGDYIAKLDASGNPLWIKSYMIINYSGVEKSLCHPDGYIYMASSRYQPGGIKVVKFDTMGNYLGQKSFDFPNTFSIDLSDAIIDNSKNLLFIGINYLDSSFVIKVDTSLNILNAFSFQNTNGDHAILSVEQLQNGDYIFGGTINKPSSSGLYGTFLRTDSVGQIISSRFYEIDSVLYSQIYYIKETLSGNLILVSGYNSGNAPSPPSLVLLNVDLNGDTLSTHFYRGSQPNDVEISNDGNVIVLFHPLQYSAGFNSILLKTNLDGSYSCNQLLGNINVFNDSLTSSNLFQVNFSNDTISFLLTSISDSTVFFTEIDYCLYTQRDDILYDIDNYLNVYPNPFSEVLNFRTNNNEPLLLFLYDSYGRIIFKRKFTNSITFNANNLSCGIYFYLIQNKNEIFKKGKVIKK